MEDNLLEKMKERVQNQKVLDIHDNENEFIIEFLKVPVIVIEFSDDEKIKYLSLKNIPSLSEGLSYYLLELLDDYPEPNSDEFEKLPRKLKAIHFMVNFAGILFNEASLSNQLILVSNLKNMRMISVNFDEGQAFITRTHNGVLSDVSTKHVQYNMTIMATLDAIKNMIKQGLEGNHLEEEFNELINDIELLHDKIVEDIRKKFLKNTAVILSKIAIIFIIIIGVMYFLGLDFHLNI